MCFYCRHGTCLRLFWMPFTMCGWGKWQALPTSLSLSTTTHCLVPVKDRYAIVLEKNKTYFQDQNCACICFISYMSSALTMQCIYMTACYTWISTDPWQTWLMVHNSNCHICLVSSYIHVCNCLQCVYMYMYTYLHVHYMFSLWCNCISFLACSYG